MCIKANQYLKIVSFFKIWHHHLLNHFNLGSVTKWPVNSTYLMFWHFCCGFAGFLQAGTSLWWSRAINSKTCIKERCSRRLFLEPQLVWRPEGRASSVSALYVKRLSVCTPSQLCACCLRACRALNVPESASWCASIRVFVLQLWQFVISLEAPSVYVCPPSVTDAPC